MNASTSTHQDLLRAAQLTPTDTEEIFKCRRCYNRLGFAYQLAFVRLHNRFPTQQPFEIDQELLTYAGMQTDIPITEIEDYVRRQSTLSEHQERIRVYLQLHRLDDDAMEVFEQFLFDEACRLENTGPLMALAKQFLKTNRILQPTDDMLRRRIVRQRQAARQHIFYRISESLSSEVTTQLDALLAASDTRYTVLQMLKRAPGRASPSAMLRLLEKLDVIQAIGILAIDLSWLNNNYQRSLSRYARRCSAKRLRKLQVARRYTVLTCFLHQTYRDTIDHAIDMYGKLLRGVYYRAQTSIDKETRRQRQITHNILGTFKTLGEVLLDESVDDQELRKTVFDQVDKVTLVSQMKAVDIWLSGKYSHPFNLVVQRHSYLRQFAPTFLAHLEFHQEEGVHSPVIEAIQLLRELDDQNKRKLPEDAPLGFLSRTLRTLVVQDGTINKRAWECALLTAIRDEVKSGNLYVHQSKRFGRFENFFISKAQWESRRKSFFERAELPTRAEKVEAHLTQRLNRAYDRFLKFLPDNTYASIKDDQWALSSDPAEKLGEAAEQRLAELRAWLSEHLRTIKLPDLLIEVDNELAFTRTFMTSSQQKQRQAEHVCLILAAIIAHGCNIGPYTMAQLTDDVSYDQIRRVTDWQLTEEAQRSALAQVVNAISRLDVSQAWGIGKTSSSDGQRFSLNQRVLQQTYSHKLRDFALEFYSFIADNYSPFYSTAIECTDRDAAYVLDGLLYNESDLALEEHYTDTHGYTEINFAAFAMLGRRFAPRIRGLHKQRIYRIDDDKDYGPLVPLIERRDRLIQLDWICEQWDRMGHFYASLENGHATASTAMKRLAAFPGKNHFYRANRELGRVFKTEYILQYMSDPLVRQRVRRGLLKGEQLNALARQVAYGKQGKITQRDLQAMKNTSSCLTLLMACIIYWQAQEINRVVLERGPLEADVDLSLLEHISPIGWDNIILYGEYVLNRNLVLV